MWFKLYGNDLGLSVWIGSKVKHFRAFASLGQIVFLISGNSYNGKTFNIGDAAGAVFIDQVVDGPFIALFEYLGMKNALTYKSLVGDFGDDALTVFPEYDDFIDIGTIRYKFIFSQTGTNKAVF